MENNLSNYQNFFYIDFAIKFFSKNYRCGYLPIQFYAYRQRENSIMSTPRISNLANSFALCDVFHEYAYKVEDTEITKVVCMEYSNNS